jgi:hypothetical protein
LSVFRRVGRHSGKPPWFFLVTFARLALPIRLLAVVFQHGGGYDASPDSALELERPEILALLCISRKDAFAINLLGENIADYPQSYPRLM